MCCRSNPFSLYKYKCFFTIPSLFSRVQFFLSLGWHTTFDYDLLFELLLSKQLSLLLQVFCLLHFGYSAVINLLLMAPAG